MARHKAYFINGGSGRVISSIPAFEKRLDYDKDFIIVCEGGTEMFQGHPALESRVFSHQTAGLFEKHLRDRDIVTLEPYRVWEYYNQKCSIAQAFDIEINGQGVRRLPPPTLYLSKDEVKTARAIIEEAKGITGFDKIVVIQPFGRGVVNTGPMIIDPTSRSFVPQDVIDLASALMDQYGVMIMSEFPVPPPQEWISTGKVIQPTISDIRVWAAVIDLADHFIGCDSLGQHLAAALGKTATVVTGSTFPINVSYVDNKNFDIFDVGAGQRLYSPIRVSMEDAIERTNDQCMDMTLEQLDQIVRLARKRLGKSKIYTGNWKPTRISQTMPVPTEISVGDSGKQAQVTFTANPLSAAIAANLNKN